MKEPYILPYLLGMIAVSASIVCYLWFLWQDVILGAMLLLGFVSIWDPFILPWFLYPLEPIIKLFAVLWFLMTLYMAWSIDEIAENIKEG